MRDGKGIVIGGTDDIDRPASTEEIWTVEEEMRGIAFAYKKTIMTSTVRRIIK